MTLAASRADVLDAYAQAAKCFDAKTLQCFVGTYPQYRGELLRYAAGQLLHVLNRDAEKQKEALRVAPP